MLIWLASYPRSGNRFFRTICQHCYNLAARDRDLPPRLEDPHYELVRTLDTVIASPRPALVKTHDLPGADAHPSIYLLRDGRDALVSYAHFALVIGGKLAPEAVTPEAFHVSLRNLLLEERSPFGSWADNVRAWTARPNTAVVRYEHLVRDPGGEVERALAAVGCRLQRVSDDLPTFESMKKVNGKLVRRGVVGSWKDEFPADLLPLFWKRNGDVMRACGYADRQTSAA